MANHDPFPMRSAEAQALASSVQSEDTDDQNNDGVSSWHKMGTAVSQRLPKMMRRGGDTNKEALVKGKKKTKGRKNKSAAAGEESIYDQDDLDEVQGHSDDEENGDDDNEGGDDFIDAPLRDNTRMLRPEDVADLPRPVGALVLCLQGCFFSTRRVAKRVHRSVYGDTFPWDDFIRTMVLSSTLFVMIGGYWLLRSLKDAVLTALCGVESIPKAKMLSVFVVLGVVAVYNHLLDEKSGFRKEQLFYVFGTFYGILFTGIAYLLNHPTIGLPNQTEDPARILGWVSYCGIESFGSVMVSLFWSFANSNFNLKQAKRSYGVMVATAQLGSILGPTFVNSYGHSLGIPTCYMVGAGCMLTLQLTMWTYVKMFGVVEDVPKAVDVEKKDDPKKANKAGILEGIHLFVEHNYVKGIFAISCLFMVEVTIVDYTMKVLAREHFAEEFPCLPFDEATGEAMACWNAETNSAVGLSTEAIKSFTTFMGFFGQATNGLSFLLSFFGTSAIIQYLGLRITLLLFPSICLIVIVTVRMYPTLNVVFAAMMILKANSYALNNPTKEMLYQPTSSNVKYKAKSWIDIFGARGSKALGSVVTNAFSTSALELIDKGSLVGMCVASFLIWNATFMGKKFEEYTESGYIVGETNDDDDDVDTGGYTEVNEGGKSNNIEMASRQNDESETSCAFYDDDEIGEEEEGQSLSGGEDEKHIIVATV
jgi:ATP:ADP antiporter, AAA family